MFFIQVDKFVDITTGISAEQQQQKNCLKCSCFATAVLKCIDRKITLAHRKLFGRQLIVKLNLKGLLRLNHKVKQIVLARPGQQVASEIVALLTERTNLKLDAILVYGGKLQKSI